MSVISVSFASVHFDVFPRPGKIVCPSISVTFFHRYRERHLLDAFHKISSSVARMNPLQWEDLIISIGTRVSLLSSSSLAGLYVCRHARQVTVRIIAPRGVLAKCARYLTSPLYYWTAQWFNVDWVSPNMVVRLPQVTWANEITLLHGGVYTDTQTDFGIQVYLLRRGTFILPYHWINIICRLLDIIKLFSRWM